MDHLSTFECPSTGYVRIGPWNDTMVGIYGNLYCFISNGIIELYRYSFKPSYERDEDDTVAFDHLGLPYYGYYWSNLVPGIVVSGIIVDF